MHRSDHIRAIKSVGNSATTPRDLVSDDDVRLMLYLLAESVACRMRELASKCTVVEVAVRDTELHWYCRQKKLAVPTCSSAEIAEVAFDLFRRSYSWIMRGQGSQVSLGSLESAVNLSEGDFSCSAQDIGAYSFFTNTTRIIIRTDAPLDETVTVRLWNTENMSENILLARLDKNQKICTFTHLSSRNRYAITVDNMPDISISVSSRLTFWEALSRALQNE